MSKREFWTGEELRFHGVVKNKNGGLVSKIGCTDFEMIAVSGKVKVPFVFAFVDELMTSYTAEIADVSKVVAGVYSIQLRYKTPAGLTVVSPVRTITVKESLFNG